LKGAEGTTTGRGWSAVRVTATKGEVLAELGYSTDASAGNFARELHLGERGTRPVAKLIIELLACVYDLGTGAEKGQSRYR
jgi:hypothetical protein